MAYYDLTQQGIDVQGFIDGAPTLANVPTTSTTTYTKNGKSVAFVVGQFARVAVTGGYDFYQLRDVTSGTATWEKVEYGGTMPANVTYFSPDSGEGVIPADGIRVETVAAGASISVNPDVVTVVDGSVGTATITLQVPNDGLAHVWDIILGTGSSVNITLDLSGQQVGGFIYPKGFEGFAASTLMEVSIIGIGNGAYMVRYGEFQSLLLGS